MLPSVVLEGRLPDFPGTFFAGKQVPARFKAGFLWRCRSCRLRFRHPYHSQEGLSGLYSDLPPDVWSSEKRKKYWEETAAFIARYCEAPVSVLDVGCFRGDFLSTFPAGWKKFGIEPALAAAQKAREKGITVLGSRLETAQIAPESMTVVTAFDVIEHLRQPFDALSRMSKMVRPGGYLIVFTGNAASWPWRLMSPHYWYSSLPEHVSFVDCGWFERAGSRLGLKVIRFRLYAPESVSWRTKSLQLLRAAAYALAARLRQKPGLEALLAGLPVFNRVMKWKSPPWMLGFRDHMLVVLKKDE